MVYVFNCKMAERAMIKAGRQGVSEVYSAEDAALTRPVTVKRASSNLRTKQIIDFPALKDLFDSSHLRRLAPLYLPFANGTG